MNDFAKDVLRTRVRIPPPPPFKENIMFSWFKRKKEATPVVTDRETKDEIEESLWEIKEEYDLPTEEINVMVESKRKNLQHMHTMLLKNKE